MADGETPELSRHESRATTSPWLTLSSNGPTRKQEQVNVLPVIGSLNNLPGTAGLLSDGLSNRDSSRVRRMDLSSRAQAVVAAVPRDGSCPGGGFPVAQRLESSYAIEGERPPHDRIQRWGRAIGEAGLHPITPGRIVASAGYCHR